MGLKQNFGVCVIAGLILLAVSSCSRDFPEQSEAPGPEYSALFNGSDFTGWNIEPDEGAWIVRDGLIHCNGTPANPYLITTVQSYSNFDFYAEFRVSDDCNTGIFYHVPEAGRQSRIGFESQILDDSGKTPDKNSTGAIYDVVPPMKNAMKPAGKWNQYHVRFEWPNCRIWLNGELVQDVDFSTDIQLNHRFLRGPLGLSNHGFEADYRNLWIRELPDSDVFADIFNGSDLTGWTIIGNADWHVENGEIVSTQGDGYMVSDASFDRILFRVYAANDTLQSMSGRFYYRWQSTDDPGYPVDFYDFPAAKAAVKEYPDGKAPAHVIGPVYGNWLLYRIVTSGRESIAYVNEFPIVTNYVINRPAAGKIAIFRSASDGILRFREPVIRRLSGPGI